MSEATKSTDAAAQKNHIQVVYGIEVPSPNQQSVKISGTLRGTWHTAVELKIETNAAPDLDATVDYYRIRDTMRVTAKAAPLPWKIELVQQAGSRGEHRLVIQVPENKRSEEILIEYDLDTSKNDNLTDRQIAMTYKDRVLVTEQFCTVRSDVLFVPLLEWQPETHVDVEFRVSLPEPWEFHVNADVNFVNGAYTWTLSFDHAGPFFGFRWFGMGGNFQVRDVEGVVTHRLIAPLAETGRPKNTMTPEDAIVIGAEIVEYFDGVFGKEKLEYVNLAPPLGVGRDYIHVFLVPYPRRILRGAGGQHSQGTVYVFHSIHEEDPLSHTGAHEYFHAYNDGSLESSYGFNAWFAEGYTEVQATLSHLIRRAPSDRRAAMYKVEIARNWATMTEPAQPRRVDVLARLIDDKVIPPAASGDRERPSFVAFTRNPDPPVGRANDREFGMGDYSRLIRGRSFMLMHIIALLFEDCRPYRQGFESWFEEMYRKFGLEEREKPGPLYDTIIECALAAAEPKENDTTLADFLEKYVVRNTEFLYADLVYWCRWAEQRGLFGTLFAQNS